MKQQWRLPTSARWWLGAVEREFKLGLVLRKVHCWLGVSTAVWGTYQTNYSLCCARNTQRTIAFIHRPSTGTKFPSLFLFIVFFFVHSPPSLSLSISISTEPRCPRPMPAPKPQQRSLGQSFDSPASARGCDYTRISLAFSPLRSSLVPSLFSTESCPAPQ